MQMDGDHQDYSTEVGNFERFMRPAVLCLSGVILFVVLLHLYAHCLVKHSIATTRRNRIIDITIEEVASEHPKVGLDASLVASLPLFSYQTKQLSFSEGRECAVCLSAFEEEEMAKLLPNCQHIFHVECIDMWLHSHSTCPVCRTAAEPAAHRKAGSLEPVGSSSVGVDLQAQSWNHSV